MLKSSIPISSGVDRPWLNSGNTYEHGDVGHNHHIIFRAGRVDIVEDIRLLLVVGQCAVVMPSQVHLLPRFSARKETVVKVWLVDL